MIVHSQQTEQYTEVPDKQAMIMILSGDVVQVSCNAKLAYWYARDVIKGPWPAGEAAIATDPYWAYEYAHDVIGKPWPPGEAAIAKDPKLAYWYARDVIKGPWPAGEAAISSYYCK